MIDIIHHIDRFSNWVFLLSLLYYFKVISFNPIILLVIVSVATFLSIVYFIYTQQDYEKIERRVFVLLSMKLFPLYLLRKSKVYFSDFILSNIIFISYIIYLKYIRDVTIIEIYSDGL